MESVRWQDLTDADFDAQLAAHRATVADVENRFRGPMWLAVAIAAVCPKVVNAFLVVHLGWDWTSTSGWLAGWLLTLFVASVTFGFTMPDQKVPSPTACVP